MKIVELSPSCFAETLNGVLSPQDGRSIVSAWNDGKIRAFLPESGKLYYVINNAHCNGVTALAVTSDCSKIVSGGGEGQVRCCIKSKVFEFVIVVIFRLLVTFRKKPL